MVGLVNGKQSRFLFCTFVLMIPSSFRVVLAVYLLAVVGKVYGQSQTIQAIEEIHQQETRMFELVNEANKLVTDSSVDDAISKVQEALSLSFEINNSRGEAFCYQTLGAIQLQRKNFEEAISYYTKAVAIFKKNGDAQEYYDGVKFLALANEGQGNYREAITRNKEFLSLALTRQNRSDELYAKNALGRVLFNNKQYAESNKYYQQLLVSYRSNENLEKVSETYDFIGKCYAGMKDTINALKYFGLAGTLGDSQKTDLAQANSWQNVSRSYNSIGEYDKSVEYEKKAKVLNKNRKDYKGMYSNNQNIANDYIFMNRADEAIPFLLENIDLSNSSKELKSNGETYRALSEAYAQLGKLEEAKQSFDQYVKVQEQVIKAKYDDLENSLKVNSSFGDKEQQIQLLIKDKELDEEKIQLLESKQKLEAEKVANQRKINYVLVALTVLLFVGLGFFYRSSRQKQMANKLLSIRSLRSQMNPHFIFNSLNSVNSFISQSDERSANKYLSEFARLMRTVLEHSKLDFVMLSAEIEVLERYLKLEHIRFHDHFDYTFTIDEDLETERMMIPPMLIQPYIENAIWHGLRYKETKGKLQVLFRKKEEGVHIQIEDDGIGRKQSEALKTKNQKQGKSTGIRNTSARLQLLNEVHGIRITSTTSDLHEDGTGTLVELWIPKIDIDSKKVIDID